MAKRVYRVVVDNRTFRLCDSKNDAVECAKLVFDAGYNNVWVAHKNYNHVPNTPIYKREV